MPESPPRPPDPRLPRLVPDAMRVRDLDHRERLTMTCRACGRQIGRQGYDMARELPPNMLVIGYVARHYFGQCSTPARRVRPIGRIEPHPRSGAEGGARTYQELAERRLDRRPGSP